jgi:hypothetical protein
LLKQFFLLPNRISQLMDFGTSVRLPTLIWFAGVGSVNGDVHVSFYFSRAL